VVDDQAIRAALERHWSDITDQEILHEIYHEDVVVEFPQSGERIRGLANLRAMQAVYPAGLSGTLRRIRGSGTLWTTEGVVTYDGTPVHTVAILEFRGGKVAHETDYFGDPWEPPAWRSQWVERDEPATERAAQESVDAL
jgi:hypothetical protein